jgi:hypothetical protein
MVASGLDIVRLRVITHMNQVAGRSSKVLNQSSEVMLLLRQVKKPRTVTKDIDLERSLDLMALLMAHSKALLLMVDTNLEVAIILGGLSSSRECIKMEVEDCNCKFTACTVAWHSTFDCTQHLLEEQTLLGHLPWVERILREPVDVFHTRV